MLSRAMSVEAKQAKGRIQREMPLRQSFLRRDKWDISVGENPQGRMELKFHQKKIFSCRHYCFILIFVSFNSFIRGKIFIASQAVVTTLQGLKFDVVPKNNSFLICLKIFQSFRRCALFILQTIEFFKDDICNVGII